LRAGLAFFFGDLRAEAREALAGERFAADFTAAFLPDFFTAFRGERFATDFLAGRLADLRDLLFFAMTMTSSYGLPDEGFTIPLARDRVRTSVASRSGCRSAG
jgi:hypothetical protein